MRMRDEIKRKPHSGVRLSYGVWIGAGVAFLVLAAAMLGLTVYEGFFGGGSIQMVELPGFHELNLTKPGLYAGVYQHRGTGPFPIKALSQLDVRIMSKTTYEEVPVLLNNAGQTFD